jgi:hypothetical protein
MDGILSPVVFPHDLQVDVMDVSTQIQNGDQIPLPPTQGTFGMQAVKQWRFGSY